MQHTLEFRYGHDHTLGHREFWASIWAEVRNELELGSADEPLPLWYIVCSSCGDFEHNGAEPLVCPKCSNLDIIAEQK